MWGRKILPARPSTEKNCMCLISFLSIKSIVTPNLSSTSRSLAPPHFAVAKAPTAQGVPAVIPIEFISFLLFPPHCMVATTSRLGNKRCSSPRLKSFILKSDEDELELDDVLKVRLKFSASIIGTGWWFLMKNISFGVIQLCCNKLDGGSALIGLSECTFNITEEMGSFE